MTDFITDPLQYIPSFLKITTKADERGVSELVPMILTRVQDHYIQNRTHRDICVKPRQIKFSTAVLGGNSHKVFTIPHTKMVVVAHRSDSAKFLLQTVHRFYNNLPSEMKPESDWRSSEWIRFPKLDCFIHIDSAESKTIGRSENINLAHLSECAQYSEETVTEIWNGISQSVPLGGYITLESTPKGRGGFHYRMYEAAKRGENGFKAFFYPWWWESEYSLPAENPELTEEEKPLVEKFNLSLGQIAWRRLKIIELGDFFFQEYPENDVDCWLSSDISVFNGAWIRQAMKFVKYPIRTEGNLQIWKLRNIGSRYIIGADVGAGMPKSDFSVAAVLDAVKNEHVATYRARIPPHEFAFELIRLGKRYGDAQIAVERNNHGHTTVQTLIHEHYPSVYRYHDYNKVIDDPSNLQPGWLTSGKTKPVMIDNLNQGVGDGTFTSWSENLFNEMSSMIYKGQKESGAPAGEYDDEAMAVMIALTVRSNQPIVPIKRYPVMSYM